MARHARGRQESPSEPFGFWLITVETSQSRIALPRQAARTASWLDSEAARSSCRGTIGAYGGLQIAPGGGRAADMRRAIAARLRAEPAAAEDVAAEYVDSVRFYATSWAIAIYFEEKANRFRFTLPRDARELRIVPTGGEMAAVFATGGILEVWPANDWIAHVRSVSARLREIAARALDAIRSE
jgi:hypothetical protein